LFLQQKRALGIAPGDDTSAYSILDKITTIEASKTMPRAH